MEGALAVHRAALAACPALTSELYTATIAACRQVLSIAVHGAHQMIWCCIHKLYINSGDGQ
jgi:hypothetical protein